MTTSVLKTELQMSYSLHECPYSPLSMVMTKTALKNQWSYSIAFKASNNNQPQQQKFNTAPSASKWQHQCSRQSYKCHALCINALNYHFWCNNNNNIKQSMIMINGVENIKQQSTSTTKIQHCTFCKQISTLMLKTASNVMLFAWMALITSFLDVSLWIFESVARAAHLWKALVSMHQLKWLPMNFEPAVLSKNKDICKNACAYIPSVRPYNL